MKLLSVHIDNFGKLSDYKVTFDNSFACIREDNGWGKTTLAAFLCAMLYGMEGVRKNNKSLKPRERYAPWQGGRYGGSIEIEKNGTVYRVERTFGTSSSTGDTLRVLDMTAGMKEIKIEDSPGNFLLGLGKDAFLRTAFLSGGEEGDAAELLPKLNKSINGTEQAETYTRAAEILENEKKKYKAAKGDKGLLKALGDTLDETEKDLAFCREQRERLDADERLKDEKKKALAEIEEKQERAAAFAVERENRLRLLETKKHTDEARAALAAFEERNGKKRASAETLEKCAETLRRLRALEGTLSNDALTPFEQSEYTRMRALFGNAPPTYEELDEVSRKISFTESLKARLEGMRKGSADMRFKELDDRFHGSVPSNAEIEELRRLCGEYEKALDEQNTRREAGAKKNASGVFVSAILCALFGLLALAAGVVLRFTAYAYLFYVLLALSTVLLIAAILLYGAYRRKRTPDQPDKQGDEALQTMKTRIAGTLSLYGYPTDDLRSACAQLQSDRVEYNTRKEAELSKEREIDDLSEKIREEQAEIDVFFAGYPEKEQPEDAQKINSLRTDLSEYKTLCRRLENDERSRNAAKEEARAARTEFLRLLGADPSLVPEGKEEAALREERERVYEHRRLCELLALREEEEKSFAEAHPMPEGDGNELPDGDVTLELKEKKRALTEELSALARQTDEEERHASRVEEVQARYEELKELLAEAKERYGILSKTAAYLETAENRLLARYTEPIRSAYEACASAIGPSLSEGVSVSPDDLSLRFERRGSLKKVENFSSGFLALSDICLRVAMIETAYGKDLPFLILDDPFAYLDDENAKKALLSLRDLSAKTQILYFTCHSSRAL